MTNEELEALSREVGVSVDVLRTFAGISDPTNAHLFTRESWTATLKRDLASAHVTPVDGNVFADLGFPEDGAQKLLDDADADIAQEKAPREGR